MNKAETLEMLRLDANYTSSRLRGRCTRHCREMAMMSFSTESLVAPCTIIRLQRVVLQVCVFPDNSINDYKFIHYLRSGASKENRVDHPGQIIYVSA